MREHSRKLVSPRAFPESNRIVSLYGKARFARRIFTLFYFMAHFERELTRFTCSRLQWSAWVVDHHWRTRRKFRDPRGSTTDSETIARYSPRFNLTWGIALPPSLPADPSEWPIMGKENRKSDSSLSDGRLDEAIFRDIPRAFRERKLGESVW